MPVLIYIQTLPYFSHSFSSSLSCQHVWKSVLSWKRTAKQSGESVQSQFLSVPIVPLWLVKGPLGLWPKCHRHRSRNNGAQLNFEKQFQRNCPVSQCRHLWKILLILILWGDGVAQLVECWAWSKDPMFEPHQEHRNIFWLFFNVKNVGLTHCRCTQPPCVYAGRRMITYAR